MSSSKLKAEGPRQPRCTRCRHHGLVVLQKGHAKKCPFVKCCCWKCQLITERTRINALQRKLHRDTEGQSAAGPSAKGQPPHTDTEAPQSGLGQPRPNRGSVSGSPSAEGRDQAPEYAPCDAPPPSPNPLYWGGFGPAPLPLLHIPVPMPAPFPHCSNFLVNMPWSPVPPGLYEGSLSPLMVSPYAPAPYHPHPEPRPADSRPVFRPPAPPEYHHQAALDKRPNPQEEDSEPDQNI